LQVSGNSGSVLICVAIKERAPWFRNNLKLMIADDG
jgi:hypothetical protein